jgi:hypothetical protein
LALLAEQRMSTFTFGENSPLAKLPCGFIVYRAIRRRWVVEHTGELATIAFIRRPNDTDGLSVNTESVEGARNTTQKCFAVVSLHVGRVRNIGLDVIPDEPNHANITNLPSAEEYESSIEYRTRAERLAGKLIRQSRFAWRKPDST